VNWINEMEMEVFFRKWNGSRDSRFWIHRSVHGLILSDPIFAVWCLK
jgi:hypothetical protein